MEAGDYAMLDLGTSLVEWSCGVGPVGARDAGGEAERGHVVSICGADAANASFCRRAVPRGVGAAAGIAAAFRSDARARNRFGGVGNGRGGASRTVGRRPVFRRLSVSEFEEQFLTNNPNVFSTTTSAPPAPLTQEALVDFGGTEQGPRPATPAGQLVRVPSDEESGDNETNTTRNQDEDAGVQAVVTRSQTAVREMQDISNRFAYIGEYMDSHFRLQNVLAAYHEMEALNPEQLAETSAIEVIEQLRARRRRRSQRLLRGDWNTCRRSWTTCRR